MDINLYNFGLPINEEYNKLDTLKRIIMSLIDKAITALTNIKNAVLKFLNKFKKKNKSVNAPNSDSPSEPESAVDMTDIENQLSKAMSGDGVKLMHIFEKCNIMPNVINEFKNNIKNSDLTVRIYSNVYANKDSVNNYMEMCKDITTCVSNVLSELNDNNKIDDLPQKLAGYCETTINANIGNIVFNSKELYHTNGWKPVFDNIDKLDYITIHQAITNIDIAKTIFDSYCDAVLKDYTQYAMYAANNISSSLFSDFIKSLRTMQQKLLSEKEAITNIIKTVNSDEDTVNYKDILKYVQNITSNMYQVLTKTNIAIFQTGSVLTSELLETLARTLYETGVEYAKNNKDMICGKMAKLSYYNHIYENYNSGYNLNISLIK